jgi:hypothetical protein
MAIAAIWPSAADTVIDSTYRGMAIAVRIPAGGAGACHEGGVVGVAMADPAVPAGVGTAGIQRGYDARMAVEAVLYGGFN